MNDSGQPTSTRICGVIFTDGLVYLFTRNFCGNTSLSPLQGQLSLAHPPYFIVTWPGPRLESGRVNCELMTKEVFASVVIVGNPPRPLQSVPDHLTVSIQFQQLWVNVEYYNRHRFGVPVPKRLEPYLEEVEWWAAHGCFYQNLEENQTIVQYLIQRAAVPGVNIGYESFNMMRTVAHVLAGILRNQAQESRLFDLEDENEVLRQDNDVSQSGSSSSSESNKKQRTK